MVHLLLKSNAYDKTKIQQIKVYKKPGRASKQTPGSSELTEHNVNFKQKHPKL